VKDKIELYLRGTDCDGDFMFYSLTPYLFKEFAKDLFSLLKQDGYEPVKLHNVPLDYWDEEALRELFACEG